MLRFIKSIVKSASKGAYHDPGVQKLVTRYPRFFRFIRKRLTPDEKFGLHLTIGAIITVIFIFFFFGVIQDIIGQDPLIQSDLRLINLVQIFRTVNINQVMLFFTYLGNWPVVFFGVLLLSILFFLFGRFYFLIILISSVGGGEIFIWLLKNIVQRPRPPLLNALTPATGFSFPSGHAFIAFSFYGLVAYFLYRVIRGKFWRIMVILITTLIILNIGFSRIYLGVHWPSDILAGYVSGTAWLTILITALEIRRKFSFPKPHLYIRKSFIAVISIAIFLLWGGYVGHYYKNHPLKLPPPPIDNPIFITEPNIPQDLFSVFPRTSEDITGTPMEPINIIIISTEEELKVVFSQAGWVLTDPFTVKNIWRLVTASIFHRSYPNAPGTPTFWNSRPNDFAFEKSAVGGTIGERQHIHFWPTPYILGNQRRVWFATAHLDKEIKLKSKFIIPIHTIDPAVDQEREKVKNDLLITDKVEKVQEYQLVEPTLGKNQAGDQFFTDGKADIIFI